MSFIQDHNQLKPVEVELTLWAGLPGIQFLGLPDQHLKESGLRIKSAIKAQGFQFPTGQQILVNLRPSYLKKKSRGIELAVALAYLWETGQIEAPEDGLPTVYGELSLTGEAHAPTDLFSLLKVYDNSVLTGQLQEVSRYHQLKLKTIRQLSEASTPVMTESPSIPEYSRPRVHQDIFLSKDQARLVQIAAVGGHSVLLAGPAGTGKTTLAQIIHEVLPTPNMESEVSLAEGWYPFVRPHHTTPLMTMIGGGANLFSGEISRAHGGVLFLDELLEYKPEVLEALREPFEEGLIRVARQGQVVQYPAEAQILAATNLCPCGDYSPGKKKTTGCRFSLKRCQSYSEKLSGPFVDRFQMIYFTQFRKEKMISFNDLIFKIQTADQFRRLRQQKKSNARTAIAELELSMTDFLKKEVMPDTGTSLRRRHAIIRVARTIADIEGSQNIERQHIQEAIPLAYDNFERMKSWD